VYSANPVGRLVLYLCGYRDEERPAPFRRNLHRAAVGEFLAKTSGRDLEKGRIYIPLHVAAGHGLSETDIVERRFDIPLRRPDEGFDLPVRARFCTQACPLQEWWMPGLASIWTCSAGAGSRFWTPSKTSDYDTLPTTARPSAKANKRVYSAAL